MQNNIIERLNRKLCLIYLRSIYDASCIGFMCMDERIMLTVRIEKNYYMSYVGTGNLNNVLYVRLGMNILKRLTAMRYNTL